MTIDPAELKKLKEASCMASRSADDANELAHQAKDHAYRLTAIADAADDAYYLAAGPKAYAAAKAAA
jgi:hypothetical protein